MTDEFDEAVREYSAWQSFYPIRRILTQAEAEGKEEADRVWAEACTEEDRKAERWHQHFTASQHAYGLSFDVNVSTDAWDILKNVVA